MPDTPYREPPTDPGRFHTRAPDEEVPPKFEPLGEEIRQIMYADDFPEPAEKPDISIVDKKIESLVKSMRAGAQKKVLMDTPDFAMTREEIWKAGGLAAVNQRFFDWARKHELCPNSTAPNQDGRVLFWVQWKVTGYRPKPGGKAFTAPVKAPDSTVNLYYVGMVLIILVVIGIAYVKVWEHHHNPAEPGHTVSDPAPQTNP